MGFWNRGGIRDRINETDPQKKKEHSAYERFFEGYTQRLVVSANGRERLERVYVGDYYCPALTRRQLFRVKAEYLGAFLCEVLLLVRTGMLPIVMNRTAFVGIFQAACVFFLGYVLLALIRYLPSGDRRTIYEYHTTSGSICRGALGLAVSAGGGTISALVFTLLWGRGELLLHLSCVLCYGLMTALAFGIYQREKAITYEKVKNPNGEKGETV